ncbi:hypothetical protein AKJ16_DCAP14957, partial [Drosera capensis]
FQVHSVCKPLKAFGVHTVSLHPGATVDNQIHGLKSCEPEFIVATPERLLELVSLEAIDLSGLYLLRRFQIEQEAVLPIDRVPIEVNAIQSGGFRCFFGCFCSPITFGDLV